MLLLAPTDPAAAPPSWAVLHALSLVRAAGAALQDAIPALVTLRGDTEWRSDGVQALQDALHDLLASTRVARADVTDHEQALERIEA